MAPVNSNDFGRFVSYVADSNWNFGVVEIISKKPFDFLCVRGSITYNVTVRAHVLWPVFTHVLIRCRHTADRHTQTTFTVQTHHTSIPTVVVSLMIHAILLIAFWRSVFQAAFVMSRSLLSHRSHLLVFSPRFSSLEPLWMFTVVIVHVHVYVSVSVYVPHTQTHRHRTI